MPSKSIGIFGGSGFLGSHLANDLVASGHHLRIFTRTRANARELLPLPNTDIIEVNISRERDLRASLGNCDAVINLIGILNEKRDNGVGFRQAHTEVTRAIINACFDVHVGRYLHVSALNADPFGPSFYLRTKGEAENAAMAAHDEGLATTVFRPSIMFGPRDNFFNRFAQLLKITPAMMPLACAQTKLQPVYVGNVSAAITNSIDNRTTFGRRYDLGGPEVKSLIEIVTYVADVIGAKRKIVPLGSRLSKLQAYIFEYVPGKPFSRDNLRSASEDSICRNESGLLQLGIEPKSIAEIVPTYLGGQGERTRFYDMRSSARRDA